MQVYQNWYDCMQYISELVYLQCANYNSMRDLIYMKYMAYEWEENTYMPHIVTKFTKYMIWTFFLLKIQILDKNNIFATLFETPFELLLDTLEATLNHHLVKIQVGPTPNSNSNFKSILVSKNKNLISRIFYLCQEYIFTKQNFGWK